MKKSNIKKVATIIRLKEEHEQHLRKLARKRSLDENKDYSLQDLLLEAVIEKYFKNER